MVRMLNKKFLLSVILVCLIIISGCSQLDPKETKETQTVKLFYGNADNSDFVTEDSQISFTYQEEKYRVTLEQLVEGPDNKEYQANIAQATNVYGTIRQNNDLIVNLSKEFNQFGGSVAEIIAVGSVVNTMTQFDGISRVKILIEGEELIGPSGQPRGFMQSFEEETNTATEQVVKLYFSNQNADAVRGETRIIKTSKTVSEEEVLLKVLEELIKGPEDSKLARTIPTEVKVLNVKIDNGIAIVNFSEDMHTKHWGGAAGESMTINSIVNTLTEFDYIQQVKMTVEGRAMAIEHAILEDPLPRNEDMIEN